MNTELSSNDRHGRTLALFGLAALLVTVALLLVAVFVWPTRYRYDHMNIRGSVLPVRVDRIMGVTEVLYPSGWATVGGGSRPRDAAIELPRSELARLESRGEWRYGSICIAVYNGSGLHVTQITVELVIWEETTGREIVRRLYAVDSSYSGPSVSPRSSSEFSFNPHFTMERGHAWSFQVVGAQGYRAD